MRKINIFNRNINSASYRRKPVSGGFNCNVEIPRFRGMTGKARGVAECKFPSREGWRVAPAGVWFAVIAAILIAMPSFAAPTELDKKTVASKAYVDTKQDIIETGLVEFEGDDATINVPSVVTTNVAGTGLSGNQIGFMTLSALNSTATPFGDFAYGNNGDNFVPSAALVASRLEELSASVWNAMPVALSWIVDNDNGANRTNAINAYNSTFGNGTNNWAGNATDLINGDFLARSLALKQNKIPAGTAGNVVTYTGTAGTVGWVAVSSTEDYNQQNELTNGLNLANVQLVSTKQNKMVCAGWDSETHTDEHCWLWSIE